MGFIHGDVKRSDFLVVEEDEHGQVVDLELEMDSSAWGLQ